MSTPLRGTQSLVGQMGWVFARPGLTALEILWRWIFGLPLVIVAQFEASKILIALPPESAGLTTLDPQNPWMAAGQLSSAWALYQPHLAAVLHWLMPLAALAWVVVSGLGRSLIFKRMIFPACESGEKNSGSFEERPSGAKAPADAIGFSRGINPPSPSGKRNSGVRFRPVAMIVLQSAWLGFFALACWGWLGSMQWVAATHIPPNAEPDLIGFAIWVIFLSLGFFTFWALTSWVLSVAPLTMLLEGLSPFEALRQSFKLGKPMTAKLVEINMVMGIVNLALIVLAMVFSAAPLPFGDQLGPETLHAVWIAALIFYLVASDYFQVVRLKGYVEFWKIFRGFEAGTPEN